MPDADSGPDAQNGREGGGGGGGGKRGFGKKLRRGQGQEIGEGWILEACRKTKRRRYPTWLLKLEHWNIHFNVQALPANLLPTPNSGGLPIPCNLSKEVSRGGWENFITNTVFFCLILPSGAWSLSSNNQPCGKRRRPFPSHLYGRGLLGFS